MASLPGPSGSDCRPPRRARPLGRSARRPRRSAQARPLRYRVFLPGHQAADAVGGEQGLVSWPRTLRSRSVRRGRAREEGLADGREGAGRRRTGQGCTRVSARRSSSPTPARARRRSRVQACGVCHTDLHYREGAHQRRLPVPARPRGRRRRRRGRRRGHRVWLPATTSSSTGARSAGSAGRAGAAVPGTASPPTTPPSR